MKVTLHPEMSEHDAWQIWTNPELSPGDQEWIEWAYRARWVFGETPYAAIKGALQAFVATHENKVDVGE